jgi:hypothetical protein
MGWLQDRLITLKEAAGHRRYLIGGLGATALAVVDAASGNQYMSWLTGAPPWAIIAIVFLSVAILWLLDYANILRKAKEPSVECIDLEAREISPGLFMARVRIVNLSTSYLDNVVPYLERILYNGEPLNHSNVDLPITLFSQERLRDRTVSGQINQDSAQPIKLRAGQKKWIELFELKPPLRISLYMTGRNEEIVLRDPTIFECEVLGVGKPLPFSLVWAETENTLDGAWKIELKAEDGTNIK